MVARWSALRTSIVWAAVGLLALGLSCAGAVQVSVLSPALDASPGAFVTPVFAVTDSEGGDLSVRLEYDSPAGWEVLGAQTTLVVPAGEEGTIFATVIVPADTPAGTYELTMTATSDSDESDSASAAASILVEAVSDLALSGPDGRSLAPGASTEYSITLANRGNVQEDVLITASSSKGFPVEIQQTAVSLAPSERATIVVKISVPVTADPGQDVLTITATSTLYDGVEEDLVIFTKILPPTPDLVGGTLMETLSGRLRLSFDRDEISGVFDSRMSFSASGRVLDGFFSTFLSVTDPLGPDPIDVTSYSLLYRREPVTASIGNVSKRLTDLVSLTCEGGSFEVDETYYDITLVSGLSDDEARFGGRFAFGPEVANVGLTYFEARTPTSREAIVGGTAESEPIEDWRLLAEGALGTADGLSSFAFLFATELDTSGYFLDAQVYSVDTQFPGSMQDSAGIELSQRLRLDDFSLSVSFAHEWDNVDRNPLLATQTDDQMGLNLSWTPLEDGPRLSSTAEFGWTREDDPAGQNDIDLLLAAGMRETDGVFPYTFSGEIEDQLDLTLGTHTRTLTFVEGAGLSVDSFYLFLELTQEKLVDVVTDTVLSGATDVSILFRPEGTLHEASISLGNTEDELDLSVSLDIRLLDAVDVTFDGSIAWDRADATPVSFGWGITFNVDLAIPLPFLVTKGRIEGHLFVDVDGDGAYGPADRPVEGGTLAINGTEVSTNEAGLFRFPPLAPGTYPLAVDGLPPNAAAPDAIQVVVEPGETTQIEIPLRPVLVVEGVVFDDVDQDRVRGAQEDGFADVLVRLEAEEGALRTARSDALGRFAWMNLAPGRYVASLDPATLPARFEPTTPEEVAVDVAADAEVSLAFGGTIRPRETIITFQPPTADFTISPAEAAAGVPVTFDGSLSFDFDGAIDAYAWDFDGDGTIDATDAIATWTYAIPGSFDASLTVTDDAGNQDTLTRTISVGGEAIETELATEPTQTESAVAAPTAETSIQPPVADFSFSPEAPEVGVPVAFDASLSVDFDGEIVAYGWDFDADGADDATGVAALRVYPKAGTFDVTLRVVDDGGNTDALTRSITITGGSTEPASLPPSVGAPSASFSYIPGQPVAGEPVTFDASAASAADGEITSYAWDFDSDGVTDATDPLLEHTFPVAGLYTVSLTVTDDAGASDTVSHAISVAEPSPPADEGEGTFLPPIADFSYGPNSPLVGEPIEFNGMLSFDFDGEIAAYAWDFESDGLVDATEAIVLHVFPVAGSFSVRLTVTDTGGATDTIQRTITVE